MNYFSMTITEFEKRKNQQASAITAGVAGAILLLVFLIKWPIPTISQPKADEYIEINLGSSTQGFGKDQPQLPGDPAPVQSTSSTPPQPAQSSNNNTKAVETDDHAPSTSPTISNPTTSNPKATQIDNSNKTPKSTEQQPVPTPPAPKAKAVMGHTMGGNGTGGNGATTYTPGSNQGISGGNGDQGVPGGNPNGTVYTGNPKSFGVKEFSIPNQSFEDDFDRNAKIAMDIVTDGNGKVVSANYTSRGSSGTATSRMKQIARDRAFQLKVGSNMKGTVVFNFQVKS